MLRETRNAGTETEQTASNEQQKEELTSRTGLLILAAICFGYFMVILDTTVVNLALPDIGKQLGANVTALQWIVNGYTLVFASLLLTAGALGDRLGNKKIFLLGLVIFTSASARCGLAPNMWILQIARVVQGLGAALQVPASLALLNQSFHDPTARARAIGVWGGVAGIGAAAGPVIGGLLVSTLSWRSVFFVNVPIGIVGFLLTLRYVPAVPALRQRGLDLAAQIAGIISLGLLTLAFTEGNSWGWLSLPILGSFLGFIIATVMFVLVERHTANPMLPLSFFRSQTFSAGNAVGLLLNFGFYGQLFVMSLYFQQVRGYSALLAGLALLSETIIVAIASPLSGRVAGHVGPRLPMLIGLLAGSAGFLAMLLVNAESPYLLLCPMLIAIGFGTSFTMPAMTTAVVAAAPRERSGIASAVLNAARQAGGALGVALLGSMVGRVNTFIPGMHVALTIAGAAFLLGALLTFFYVHKGRSEQHA